MRKIKILPIILIVIMCITVGCGNKKTPSDETKIFTDSLGREISVPKNPEKIAVTGPFAQIIVFALAPNKLVGTAIRWEDKDKGYIDEKYLSLPCIGQLQGGKGDLNLETLMMSGAELVIDVGDQGDAIKEDLEAIQNQTNIPCAHIAYSAKDAGQTYRMLGELLEMEDEAEELANYCEKIYERTKDISEKVKKEKLLYIVGEEGLNVIAKDSYHSEIIDLLSDNVAKVDNPTSKGTGNEVDMEQILTWNPDVILVSPNTIYDEMGTDKIWSQISAVKNGKYYEVPEGPYNWMGFPPSVQRLLGMSWMAKILYPKEATYDLYDETRTFYKLFYHHELTKGEYNKLVK